MTNTLKSFVHEIYSFLQSVTIFNPYILKHHQDRVLVLTGGEYLPLEENPYLVNMFGKRYTNILFPELDDPIITIISYDTGEEIELNREVLEHPDTGHPITILNHQNSPQLLLELFEKYPEQTDFIKSCFFAVNSSDILEYSPILIQSLDGADYGQTFNLTPMSIRLRPVTKNTFIMGGALATLLDNNPTRKNFIQDCFNEAELSVDEVSEYTDWNVLTIPDFSLVADGSEFLLPVYERGNMVFALKEFLKNFENRWNVPSYFINEKYASTVFWSMLWNILPVALLRQRILNLNTASAHSDIIWIYLDSHGLRDYRDILDRPREMFLYKNIRYIKKTLGSRHGVKILVENLLTNRGMELVEKQVMLNELPMVDDILPKPIVVNKPIDSVDEQYLLESFNYPESVSDVYDREVTDGLEPSFGPDQLPQQYTTLQHVTSTRLPTKLVEIQTGRYGTRKSTAFFKFALESLLYWMTLKNPDGSDALDYSIPIKLPNSPILEVVSIREALGLFFYIAKQYITPTIEINEDNVDDYIGKTILVEGNRVKLNLDNILTYVGLLGTKLVGPMKFPETFWVTRPFNKNQVVVDPIMYRHGVKFDINSVIPNVNDSRHTSFMNIEDSITCTHELDRLFTHRITDIATVEKGYSVVNKEAYTYLYDQILINETLSTDWLTDGSFDTIDDWIAANESLTNAFNSLDVSKNREFVYEEFGIALIRSIILPDESIYMSTLPHSAVGFKLIRELMEQLCTYDVAFLDTDSRVFEPIYSFETYVDNGVAHHTESQGVVKNFDSTRSMSIYETILPNPQFPRYDNNLLWRATDNLMADAIMETDGDASAYSELYGTGAYDSITYIDDNQVEQEVYANITDLTPFITGTGITRSYSNVNTLYQISYIDARFETVPLPDSFIAGYSDLDPTPIPPVITLYTLPLRGTIVKPTVNNDGLRITTEIGDGAIVAV